MPSVETVDNGAVRVIAINRPERRNALDFASLVAVLTRRALAECAQRAGYEL